MEQGDPDGARTQELNEAAEGWFLRIESPIIMVGLGTLLFVVMVLGLGKLPDGYFHWGAPVYVFGQWVYSQPDYVILLLSFFLYRGLHEWARNVTDPYVDNVREHDQPMTRSHIQMVIMIAMYDSFKIVDLVVIVNLCLSQFSFLLAAFLSITITSIVCNTLHFQRKRVPDHIPRHPLFIKGHPSTLRPLQFVSSLVGRFYPGN